MSKFIDWWVHLSWSQAVLCGLVVFITVIALSAIVDFILWMRTDESKYSK